MIPTITYQSLLYGSNAGDDTRLKMEIRTYLGYMALVDLGRRNLLV